MTVEREVGPQQGGVSSDRTYLVLLSLLLSTGIVADIKGVALSPLVGTMTKELALTTAEVSWAINAMGLGAAIGVGATSRLGDLVGHRKVLIPLAALGLLGVIMAALATSFLPLAIGRFLMGLAVATPLAWGLMRARATADQIRTAALRLGTVISVFTPLSLVLGGVLLSMGANWKAVFWVIAVSFAGMLVCVVLAPETPVEARAKVSLDWPGAVGMAIWLTSLLLAISQGNTVGWGSTYIVSLFAVAAVVFAIWVVQQYRAESPLMAFRGNMDVRQMIAGYAAMAAVSVAAGALYIYLPVLLAASTETGYGFGLNVLWASMPLMMILPSSFIAASLAKRWILTLGPRVAMTTGGVIVVASFVALAFAHGSIALIYVWVFIYGVGIVICFNIGWSLVAASGRTDNMSITFGVQYIVTTVIAAVTTAVVVVTLNPGAGAPATSTPFVWGFLGIAFLSLVAFVVMGLLVVPRALVDMHAPRATVPPVETVAD
jgi:MFS family permease